MPGPKNVRSVERAIDILLCFSRKRPSLDVSEFQKLMGLARPTLYRLLNTLENKGLVRSVGEPKCYELGYRVVELANLWLSQAEIVRVGQPFLHKLWLNTNETIGLMVPLSPTRRLCVLELKSREALSYAYGLGHTGLTYMGASGKIMLAHMPARDVEIALREAEAKANIPATKLRADLGRLAKAGYAISTGEVTAGTVAIASPVFDRQGAVIGSIGLYGPEVRLKKSKWPAYANQVKSTAAALSGALGYGARSAKSGNT
jgi:DNA-binding IclR family transcriptional regulator